MLIHQYNKWILSYPLTENIDPSDYVNIICPKSVTFFEPKCGSIMYAILDLEYIHIIKIKSNAICNYKSCPINDLIDIKDICFVNNGKQLKCISLDNTVLDIIYMDITMNHFFTITTKWHANYHSTYQVKKYKLLGNKDVSLGNHLLVLSTTDGKLLLEHNGVNSSPIFVRVNESNINYDNIICYHFTGKVNAKHSYAQIYVFGDSQICYYHFKSNTWVYKGAYNGHNEYKMNCCSSNLPIYNRFSAISKYSYYVLICGDLHTKSIALLNTIDECVIEHKKDPSYDPKTPYDIFTIDDHRIGIISDNKIKIYHTKLYQDIIEEIHFDACIINNKFIFNKWNPPYYQLFDDTTKNTIKYFLMYNKYMINKPFNVPKYILNKIFDLII